jgi:predicted HNH restriction endonuclease
VCIHEIKPRSLFPEMARDPFNRVALCNNCHMWIHNKRGTRNAETLIRHRLTIMRSILDITNEDIEKLRDV